MRIHVVNLGIDLNANEPEVLVSFLFVVLRFLSAINVPNQSHRDRVFHALHTTDLEAQHTVKAANWLSR